MNAAISVQHRLEYLGYRFIEKLVCAIPDQALPAMARPFAVLIYFVLRIRKKVTLQNLRIAFPEKTRDWHRKVGYFSYLHFCVVILEFMKMQKWDFTRLQQRIRRAHLADLETTAGKSPGAILVSGHFGNWEVAMGYFFRLGIRSTVVQQNQQNELVNRRMKILRQKWGMEIIDTRGAVRNGEIALNEGKMIGILGDQDAGHRGVFVPFFKRPAATHVGAALLHLKTGASLYLGACSRANARQFDIDIYKIPHRFPSNNPEEDIREISADLMRHLEKCIRKHPEQYFWMHKRWKSAIKSTG